MVLLAAADRAWAQSGLVVADVRFEGNSRYSKHVLMQRIKLVKGSLYDDRLHDEDIRTLYRFFREVRPEKLVNGDRVTLVYHVVENPLVVSVDVIGNDELDNAEILDRLSTKRGHPLFSLWLHADRKEIEGWYREMGFHFIEVRTRVTDVTGGKAVVFLVTEGPRVTVDEIEFRGNTAFEDGDLEKTLVGRPGWLLSPRDFIQRILDQDIVSLMRSYRAEGYRDVSAWLGALEFSEDKEDVRIRIDIDEGEPYTVDEIRIEGGETFPEERSILESLITIEVGDRLRAEDVMRSMSAIERYYKENAYYAAKVTTETIIREEGTGVGLVFHIDEGKPVSIDRIVIQGNDRTRDKVIRRQISVIPGAPLNVIELSKSIRRIRDTRYFTRADTRIVDTADPFRKDVLIQVEEGRTGNIRFSAGINSNLGLSGQVTLTKHNFDFADLPSSVRDVIESKAFTGGGQSLRIHASPGTTYSTFQINFIEPWMFNRRLSGEFDLYRSAFFRPGYDIERIGFSSHFGKRWIFPGERIDESLGIRAGLRIENPRVADVDEHDAPRNAVRDEGLHQIRSVQLFGTYSHLDSRVDPSEGWNASLSYELGTPIGDMEFHKIQVRGGNYWRLYRDRLERNHVLALTAAGGWMAGYGATDDVPITERFFLGGIGSVRGFAYQTIGPKSRREPTGGEAMMRASLEYSFPIYERFLGGSLFVDAGTVAEQWGYDGFVNQIRVAPGFGIRISIPLLGPRPVELAFGFAIQRFEHDDTRVFSFSFGRDF